jgi:hypothetical protein
MIRNQTSAAVNERTNGKSQVEVALRKCFAGGILLWDDYAPYSPVPQQNLGSFSGRQRGKYVDRSCFGARNKSIGQDAKWFYPLDSPPRSTDTST